MSAIGRCADPDCWIADNPHFHHNGDPDKVGLLPEPEPRHKMLHYIPIPTEEKP